MRLAFKIIFTVLVAFILLLTGESYLAVSREIYMIHQTMKSDSLLMGYALETLVSEISQTSGWNRAQNLIDQAIKSERDLKIRWVWLNAPKGDPHAPLMANLLLSSVVNDKDISFEIKDKFAKPRILTYIPVLKDKNRAAALELSLSFARAEEHIRKSISTTLLLISLTILLGGIWLMITGINLIGKPLKILSKKAELISQGHFDDNLVFKGKDELAKLAGAFNHMSREIAASQNRLQQETASKIAALEQLRHTERLATLGRLSSGVAHELGTPLNIVSGRSKMLLNGHLSPLEITENASIIHDQSERMAKIIQQLLHFARRRSPQKTNVKIHDVIQRCIELLQPFSKKQAVTILFDNQTPGLEICIDPSAIQQVLTNLMLNGIQAMPTGGQLTVRTAQLADFSVSLEHKHQSVLAIAVSDTGIGITQEHLEHVFEPFFTTKDVGQGTGLGLSIAHGIAQDHDGFIEVTSEEKKGACFTLYLPLRSQACKDES